MNNDSIKEEFDYIEDKCHINYHRGYYTWHQCDKHFIKYRGVVGDCPLCMVKTFIYEKIRIEEVGY
jgi:hypothetical protein